MCSQLASSHSSEVQRHLIIPAPPRVQLPPRLADAFDQLGLDDHVDVFQRSRRTWKLSGLDVPLDRLRGPSMIASRSASVISPTLASIVAWAMEPAMSCL